jgi:hypothetical protein
MKKRKHGFNEFVGIVYKFLSIKYNADQSIPQSCLNTILNFIIFSISHVFFRLNIGIGHLIV